MSKIWFITGASRGFGREWSIAALERGDSVAATVRDVSTIDDLVRTYGANLLPLQLDVDDRASDFAAVARAHEHFGRLDVVVNNAGFAQRGMIEELSEFDVRSQIETNLFGPIWITQAALPLLRAQRSGHIVQVSSLGGLIASPDVGMYAASKWALEAFSDALAKEVKAFGIKVTIVEPGAFSTELIASERQAAILSDYSEVRNVGAQARSAVMSAVGDPAASGRAMLKIIDSDEPPLRVFFGRMPLAVVTAEYESRLKTWNAWQSVSVEAQG